MKFDKLSVTKLDEKIREIFNEFEVSGLRINKNFVEFTYQNVNDPRAGNEIEFEVLQKLYYLLKPEKMQVNGWTDNDGCERCSAPEHFGYVVAYLKK